MKKERYNLSIAVFVILMKGEKICMIRREGTGWMDGYYSVAAGGLEQNETLSAAAAREAKEEIGVIITEQNLKLRHSMHVRTEDRSWIGHYFVCENWQGAPYIAEPEKHGDLRWVNITELPDKTIPYVRQAVGQIAEGIIYSEHGWATLV